MLTTVLIVVLMLGIIGAIPKWPYSREWGYGPTSTLGLALLILLVLVLADGF